MFDLVCCAVFGCFLLGLGVFLIVMHSEAAKTKAQNVQLMPPTATQNQQTTWLLTNNDQSMGTGFGQAVWASDDHLVVLSDRWVHVFEGAECQPWAPFPRYDTHHATPDVRGVWLHTPTHIQYWVRGSRIHQFPVTDVLTDGVHSAVYVEDSGLWLVDGKSAPSPSPLLRVGEHEFTDENKRSVYAPNHVDFWQNKDDLVIQLPNYQWVWYRQFHKQRQWKMKPSLHGTPTLRDGEFFIPQDDGTTHVETATGPTLDIPYTVAATSTHWQVEPLPESQNGRGSVRLHTQPPNRTSPQNQPATRIGA